MGEEMEANAIALVREFRVHDASETLLRDWAEHAGAAAGKGLHPFHAPGYDPLLHRIRDHEGKAGERLPAPLARVLEEHEALVRADREARKLTGRLDACLEKRDALLERAKQKLAPWQPVVELGQAACALAPRGRARPGERTRAPRERSLRGPPGSALGGRAKIERAVERIERAAVLDHLSAEGRGGVRDPGRPRPGDRPAPLLPAGARESLRPDVGLAIANPRRRGEGVREERARDAREDERPGSTAEHDEDAARGLPAGTRARAATDDLPFVRREDYGAWRLRAERAVDNANSIARR